jgi:hypothetical protein
MLATATTSFRGFVESYITVRSDTAVPWVITPKVVPKKGHSALTGERRPLQPQQLNQFISSTRTYSGHPLCREPLFMKTKKRDRLPAVMVPCGFQPLPNHSEISRLFVLVSPRLEASDKPLGERSRASGGDLALHCLTSTRHVPAHGADKRKHVVTPEQRPAAGPDCVMVRHDPGPDRLRSVLAIGAPRVDTWDMCMANHRCAPYMYVLLASSGGCVVICAVIGRVVSGGISLPGRLA